jgi:hypothetical protein
LEEDRRIAVQSSTGGGGGGGAVPNDVEVSSFKPGAVGASTLVFSHVTRHSWDLQSLLIFAGTAPAADYSFDVNVAGTVQTVTLAGGAQSDTYSINGSLANGDRLFVVSEDSIDSNLADLHCSFDVLPA